jgi:hypothetical protein
MEIWKDVKDYEGLYQVSDLGRVKSLYRLVNCKGGAKKSVPERILKPSTTTYEMVQLNKLGKYKWRTVHSLVAESFLFHKSKGLKVVIDHIDRDKLNNKLPNLRIVTARENSMNSSHSKGKLEGGRKSSKYVGVSWITNRNKWVAAISINCESVYLGGFDVEEDARDTYLKAVKYEHLYKGVKKLFREQLKQIKL